MSMNRLVQARRHQDAEVYPVYRRGSCEPVYCQEQLDSEPAAAVRRE